MRDFHAWMQDNGKTVDVTEGSAKRAGVRSHAYPALYSRGQYTDLGLTTTSADAAYYLSKKKKKDD